MLSQQPDIKHKYLKCRKLLICGERQPRLSDPVNFAGKISIAQPVQRIFIYLKKERSQSETAAALNLHRNSLTYRLQRINELLDEDLNDEDTRFHMLLSFKFLSL